MRKLIIIGVSLFALFACKKETGYIIRGEFPGAPEGTMIYLQQDSTTIKGGKFVFQGRLELPELAYLKVEGINSWGMPDYKGTPIWLENAEMQVSCPWEHLVSLWEYTSEMNISGSLLNDQYQDYRKKVSELGTGRDSLWKIYQKVYLFPAFKWKEVDVKAGMEVMKQIQHGRQERRRVAEQFIAEHPSSPVSVDLLLGLLYGQNYTVAEAEKMMNSLDPALKQMPLYEKLTEAFQNFSATAKGEKYMDVTLLDRDGKAVKLSDVIIPGKYNMLEFWASWCGPCRGEIPHLRRVHEVLGKDFNIISISLDEKRADWLKAVGEEGMLWTQLNLTGGFDSEICKKYNITGVPYSLILDGEGRIVAGELRGAELDILLQELFGEKAKNL